MSDFSFKETEKGHRKMSIFYFDSPIDDRVILAAELSADFCGRSLRMKRYKRFPSIVVQG